jgi:hypothetical protein
MIECVTMSCADCGCVVVRGRVVRACERNECCCAELPIQTMETLASEIRRAMELVDLPAMGDLLAPDARWGAPEQDVPTCRDAQQILSWYEVARDNGVRADVTESVVIGDNIVIGLNVHPKPDDGAKSRDAQRWQVLSVKDGLVAEIRGYERRRMAIDFATSGVSNW